jgi:hypothetical protein
VSAARQAELREMTDANVVPLVQRGDSVAFERIYRLHDRKIRNLSLHIVEALAAAEGLTQIRQDSYEVPDPQFDGSLSGLASCAPAR